MIKAVVTDIEGTTSSLAFVKEVLFPYARTHLAEFVRTHRAQNEVKRLLDDVVRETGRELDLEGAIAQLIDWIDRDQKVTPLKSLQGLIWEAGYRQGAYRGHVYADAVDTLRQWRRQGIGLYVYSSGSVHAQKLLFAHTEYGDLTPLFKAYFDTHVGAKREVQSYLNIRQQINLSGSDILFLSDIKEELDAAAEAGLRTCWLVRRQAEIDSTSPHPQARHFGEIDLPRLSSKR